MVPVYLGNFYQISRIVIWEFFPKMARSRQESCDANLRRPIQPRAPAHGAGAALPQARGPHPDHPRLDRPVGRPHPQALPLVSESGAALSAAPPRQVAATGELLHALAAAAARDRGA